MERTTQETQGLYWFGPPLWCNTLLQCVVWWIASWADDEQYRGKNSLLRLRCSCAWCTSVARGDLEFSYCLWWWLVLFIEALVLSPNIEREGRQQRPF